jgi:hypothetical protein
MPLCRLCARDACCIRIDPEGYILYACIVIGYSSQCFAPRPVPVNSEMHRLLIEFDSAWFVSEAWARSLDVLFARSCGSQASAATNRKAMYNTLVAALAPEDVERGAYNLAC